MGLTTLDPPQSTLEIHCDDHNHAPSSIICILPTHRWKFLSCEAKHKVEKTLAVFRSVKVVHGILLNDGNQNLTLTDLYNVNRRRKEKVIGNSSALDYLINTNSDKCRFEFSVGEDDNVDHLFVAGIANINMFKKFRLRKRIQEVMNLFVEDINEEYTVYLVPMNFGKYERD
ncbi:hypothetical protein GEMRC1_008244 [Eukaryota sp. GEM-RC1]